MRGAVDDVFQFVQQFLRTADAECGDEHRTVVFQCLGDDRLQALAASAPVLVQAIAIGAFQHHDVCPIGRLGRNQDGRMWCAEVAGKYDALGGACPGVLEVDLYVRGAEDMAGALQADAGMEFVGVRQGEPVLVRQGDDALLDERDVLLDLFLVAAETEFEGILEDDRQELRGGLAAQDWPVEAGGQQIGNAAHVVDMYVGGDQRLDGIDGELDVQPIGTSAAAGGGFRALEQAAVDQHAGALVHVQLVAGARHAVGGAVVLDGWEVGCQSIGEGGS